MAVHSCIPDVWRKKLNEGKRKVISMNILYWRRIIFLPFQLIPSPLEVQEQTCNIFLTFLSEASGTVICLDQLHGGRLLQSVDRINKGVVFGDTRRDEEYLCGGRQDSLHNVTRKFHHIMESFLESLRDKILIRHWSGEYGHGSRCWNSSRTTIAFASILRHFKESKTRSKKVLQWEIQQTNKIERTLAKVQSMFPQSLVE